MLAAEQGAIHDDPGSILAPLDGAVREFFLHDAPYGQKSVSIHYLDPIVSGACIRYRLAVFFRKIAIRMSRKAIRRKR